MRKAILVDCADSTGLAEILHIFLREENFLARQIKCTNCGAAMTHGRFVCEYCGTEWVPDPTAEPDEYRHYVESRRPKTAPSAPEASAPESLPDPQFIPEPGPAFTGCNHVLVFILLLLLLGPVSLIYMWLKTPWKRSVKTMFTLIIGGLTAFILIAIFVSTCGFIDDGTEAILADAPTLEQRRHSSFNAADIYAEMASLKKESKENRQAFWKDHDAGKWVKWQGAKVEVSLYDTLPSELRLQDPQSAEYEIIVHFDNIYQDQITQIPDRALVTVSGRLWRFNYSLDEIHLGDGLIVSVAEPGKATP